MVEMPWSHFRAPIVNKVEKPAIASPLSGWVMASSGEHPVAFFGLFELPAIVSESEMLHELAEQTHKMLTPMLMGALVLHLVGALKHFEVWSRENWELENGRFEEDVQTDQMKREIAQLGL